MRRGSLPWTMSACALAAGCNALLGNSDHGLTAEDASTFVPSIDGGAVVVSGSPPEDSGTLGPPVPDAQQGADGEPGADAGGEGSWDAGSDASGGDSGVTSIAFVQVASRDSKSSVSAASATYSSPQKAGDLDVVVVGWSEAARAVTSISDSTGNSYALAMAPTSTTGVTLAIYYATNIAGAASNTVTVELDADDFLCLAILEYSGVSQLDQTAASTGSGNTASTGAVVTSLPRELVFGAGEPDQNGTANFASAGLGFDERVITGISGMLAEDAITSLSGTYMAGGGLTGSSAWAMQVVTFK